MIKYILFLLSEYYYELAVLQENEIVDKAGAGGAKVSIRMLDAQKWEEDWKRLTQTEGTDKGELLVFTDKAEPLQRLLKEGYYVIAVYHEKNKEQGLTGARYAVEDLFALEYSSYEGAYLRLAGLPWDILETEHLRVRESTVTDVEDFYRIYQDPSITYYMEALFPEKEAEIAYMKSYIEQIYGFYGFGLWTVILKENGQIIGRAGLSVREGYDEPELGFVIDVQHQGKGYGFEVCTAILKYAKGELEFDRVQALVDKDNLASVRLLKKLGFTYENDVIERERHYDRFLKNL